MSAVRMSPDRSTGAENSDSGEVRAKQSASIASVLATFESIAIALLMLAGLGVGLTAIVLRPFGVGLPWADGVVVLLIVSGGFVGAAAAVRTEEHLRFDLVINRLAGSYADVVRAIVDCAVGVFVFWLLDLAIRYAIFSAHFMGVDQNTTLPAWIPYAMISAALAGMGASFIIRGLWLLWLRWGRRT
jgi:TRAP-type C4-dicarboxylate transport system permease small subunit